MGLRAHPTSSRHILGAPCTPPRGLRAGVALSAALSQDGGSGGARLSRGGRGARALMAAGPPLTAGPGGHGAHQNPEGNRGIYPAPPLRCLRSPAAELPRSLRGCGWRGGITAPCPGVGGSGALWGGGFGVGRARGALGVIPECFISVKARRFLLIPVSEPKSAFPPALN